MLRKNTYFYPHKTLRIGNKLMDLSIPRIMGILNITPDSFYDGGEFLLVDDALKQAEKMIKDGVDIIDVGGMSSKPGAHAIEPDDESKRVIAVIEAIKKRFGEMPISIDTIHSKVARQAIDAGATVVNDISAGSMDKELIDIVAKSNVAYILMHMQGTPLTMQQHPQYDDVVKDVFQFLLDKCRLLTSKGIHDIIIDPGFGFGKTVKHNYQLADQIQVFQQIGFPIMAGISRKSMICKLLKINPDNALNGTTALHAILLLKGVNILRVHDVKEARQVIEIAQNFQIK